VERLDSGYDVLYQVMRIINIWQIFETFASEIERNLFKVMKVVAMSELKSRFFQLLSEEVIEAPNNKSLYLPG
jgi:hypothetical protein